MGLFGKKGIFGKIFKVAAPALFGPLGGAAAGLLESQGKKKKKKGGRQRGGTPHASAGMTYGPAPSMGYGQPGQAPQAQAPYPFPRFGPAYSPEMPQYPPNQPSQQQQPPWQTEPTPYINPAALIGPMPPSPEQNPIGLPPIDEAAYNQALAGVTDIAEA